MGEGATRVLPTTQTQLPVSAYFDEAFYKQEKTFLFQPGPSYIGHELMVPQVGDYYVLETQKQRHFLKRTATDILLLSNICRHRQALMLTGQGNSINTICPLHRWTYDLEGKLIGAPHFRQNPCLNLSSRPLTNWNGLLFDSPRNVADELAKLSVAKTLNFSGYVFERATAVDYLCNWKTFIEVYLEDYHVEAFHPGLGQFVTCHDLVWEFNEHYSVQTVGLKGSLEQSGTAIYRHWQQQIHRLSPHSLPDKGAIWMLYYPNVMIEWYPYTLIVSTLIPQGPQLTTNIVEYYYPEEIAWFEPDFITAQQAAYQETAQEDNEICLRMEAGRRALYEAGENQIGPYQLPLEEGMQHFHQYIRQFMPASSL